MHHRTAMVTEYIFSFFSMPRSPRDSLKGPFIPTSGWFRSLFSLLVGGVHQVFWNASTKTTKFVGRCDVRKSSGGSYQKVAVSNTKCVQTLLKDIHLQIILGMEDHPIMCAGDLNHNLYTLLFLQYRLVAGGRKISYRLILFLSLFIHRWEKRLETTSFNEDLTSRSGQFK